MSFSNIKPFFRAQLNTLDLREWKDAFNIENIPSSILTNSYHLSVDEGQRRGPYGSGDQEFEVNVVVRVFKKGYRNPADAKDACLLALQNICSTILPNTVRLGAQVKNVYLEDFQIIPISETNDNSAVLEISFSCFIIINVS